MTVIEGLLPVLSPAVTLTLWDRRDMHASGNVILRVLHNSRCLKYPLPVPWRKVLWSRKGAFWMQYYRQENSIIESSLSWELKRKKFEFLSVPIKFVLESPLSWLLFRAVTCRSVWHKIWRLLLRVQCSLHRILVLLTPHFGIDSLRTNLKYIN